MPLLEVDDFGLACPTGRFHIDPWGKSAAALITHAHADHARPGSDVYYCAAPGKAVLEARLPGARVEGISYGEPLRFADTTVSFHPAGHCLGSAQIRVQAGHNATGETWVASGDYKRQPDPSCDAFEVVPCDTFITEATFALPIYRWEPASAVIDDITAWWQSCAERSKAAVLMCYSLGKTQRVLAEFELARARHAFLNQRHIDLHPSMAPLVEAYRSAGISLFPTRPLDADPATRSSHVGRLIIAPPGAEASPWFRRLGPSADIETAYASGWMSLRGVRRRRACDRGFSISDHADWDALLETIADTRCTNVLTTHGYNQSFARYLREKGLNAEPLRTHFADDDEE